VAIAWRKLISFDWRDVKGQVVAGVILVVLLAFLSWISGLLSALWPHIKNVGKAAWSGLTYKASLPVWSLILGAVIVALTPWLVRHFGARRRARVTERPSAPVPPPEPQGLALDILKYFGRTGLTTLDIPLVQQNFPVKQIILERVMNQLLDEGWVSLIKANFAEMSPNRLRLTKRGTQFLIDKQLL